MADVEMCGVGVVWRGVRGGGGLQYLSGLGPSGFRACGQAEVPLACGVCGAGVRGAG